MYNKGIHNIKSELMSYIRLFPQSFSRYDKHPALQLYLLNARGGHHIISELKSNSL